MKPPVDADALARHTDAGPAAANARAGLYDALVASLADYDASATGTPAPPPVAAALRALADQAANL